MKEESRVTHGRRNFEGSGSRSGLRDAHETSWTSRTPHAVRKAQGLIEVQILLACMAFVRLERSLCIRGSGLPQTLPRRAQAFQDAAKDPFADGWLAREQIRYKIQPSGLPVALIPPHSFNTAYSTQLTSRPLKTTLHSLITVLASHSSAS
ncbi:hypothetical protein NliqN6_0838 [Naganishia liquefaciens]|uniref:Uncharacterized protein n=1 Tax=Naganishia liquefaciens TaxID=104408 RepID=A0A8H3TNJ9_9TREE|nr:hypothetical protein NliqN6_0838 [Naganishia liquefaciens]